LQHRSDRATSESDQVKQYLSAALERAKIIEECPEIKAFKDFRNCYIAHNLSLPEPSIDETTAAERPLRYHDEKKILEETVEIANDLHLGLNRAGFDWDGSRKIARDNASACGMDARFTSKNNQHRDERGYTKRLMPPSYVTLAEHLTDIVRLACTKCERRGQYRKATLIERYGADANMVDLRLGLAAGCPQDHGETDDGRAVFAASIKARSSP
jgi:hypothetical protein